MDLTGTSLIGSNGVDGDELARNWLKRIKENDDKYYKKWESIFKCNKLEKYYQGQQWEPTGTNYEPYTINLVFSSIEIKLPTLLFQEPVYHVKAKPSDQTNYYDFDKAAKQSLLREDILNTYAQHHIINFSEHIQLAVLDAFFRFGVIEVGYSSDWVENPNADMPILRSDSKPIIDPGTRNVIKQPKKLPVNEQIYVKRIHASRFRMSGLQIGISLAQTNWCAYWEWARVEDLIANPNLKNTSKLNWSGARTTDFIDTDYGISTASEFVKSGDVSKIWHVWDNRRKIRYVFQESQSITLLDRKSVV